MPALQETVDRVRRIDVDQFCFGFVFLFVSVLAFFGLSVVLVWFFFAEMNRTVSSDSPFGALSDSIKVSNPYRY